MSEYDRDSKFISWIQFHSEFSQKRKNEEIAIVEQRMNNMEERELEGEKTGYYGEGQ